MESSPQESALQQQIEKDTKAPQATPVTHAQHIIVVLADGRKGVFAGPMLVGLAELRLKPPRITEVVICEPRPLAPEAASQEAPQDGNPQTNEKGA